MFQAEFPMENVLANVLLICLVTCRKNIDQGINMTYICSSDNNFLGSFVLGYNVSLEAKGSNWLLFNYTDRLFCLRTTD